MKTTNYLVVLPLVLGWTITCSSCKFAYVSDYEFDQAALQKDCFFEVKPDPATFNNLLPIYETEESQASIDGELVTTETTYVAGYGINSSALNSFAFLLEKAMHESNSVRTCGIIKVTRLQHQVKRDWKPRFSIITMGMFNLLGMPLHSTEVRNTYLFEVFNHDDVLVHRSRHAGKGKAAKGFYYGYRNVVQKADFDAAHEAIGKFMLSFQPDKIQ